MIKEKKVSIVGGAGGPYNNAIPVYGDNKAPNGDQVFGPNGNQLMLVNSEQSGVHYIIVDPALITKEDNVNSRFMTFKADGKINYVRAWILNELTGHGEDYAPGVEMWMEFSHLDAYEPEPAPAPHPPHKLLIEESANGAWRVTIIE